jgi:hypothetical protein
MIQIDDKEAALLVSALEIKTDDIAHRMGLKAAKPYRGALSLELDACEKLKTKLDRIPTLTAVAKA